MDKNVAVTVAHDRGRVDVAVSPDTDVAQLVTMLYPAFHGRATLSTGVDVSPFDAVGERLPAGSVVVLVDDDSQALAQASEQQHQRQRAAQLSALRAIGWATAVLLALLPWVRQAVATSSPPVGTDAWALVGAALVSALAAAGYVISRAWVKQPVPGGQLALAGILAGLATAQLLRQLLGLHIGSSFAVASWLCLLFCIIGWTWRQGPALRVAVGTTAAASVLVTFVIAVPGGTGIVAPLVMAVAAALVVIAPRVAPQVPDEQLADVPLLMTSAPKTWPVVVRSPTRLTGERVRGIVGDAGATWAMVTGGCCAAVVLAAWPVVRAARFAGLVGWAATAVVVAVVAVLALAPVSSSEWVAKAVPRLAAVFMLVEWAMVGDTWAVSLPAGAVALGLVLLGWGALGVTLASGRVQGAPFLGRLGDVGLALAMLVVVPAAFLASGLFLALWHAVL